VSRIEDFPGPSSTRGAEFRGVLRIRAKCRAGDRGGARANKPRWVRVLAITVESSMGAMDEISYRDIFSGLDNILEGCVS
jgi:hypothetical protein